MLSVPYQRYAFQCLSRALCPIPGWTEVTRHTVTPLCQNLYLSQTLISPMCKLTVRLIEKVGNNFSSSILPHAGLIDFSLRLRKTNFLDHLSLRINLDINPDEIICAVV